MKRITDYLVNETKSSLVSKLLWGSVGIFTIGQGEFVWFVGGVICVFALMLVVPAAMRFSAPERECNLVRREWEERRMV